MSDNLATESIESISSRFGGHHVSELPLFRTTDSEQGEGITYDCGCPCQPTAVPMDGAAGFEHCCCGKVHFAGTGATGALTAYLEERASRRKREPVYTRGTATVEMQSGPTEVAWAFPRD